MSVRYYHRAQVGTFVMTFYGRSDRAVRQIVARWLSLCWEKAKARNRAKYPGSLGVAHDDGWRGPPKVIIGRWPLRAGDIVPCIDATIIDEFPADPERVQEFCRTYTRREVTALQPSSVGASPEPSRL